MFNTFINSFFIFLFQVYILDSNVDEFNYNRFYL